MEPKKHMGANNSYSRLDKGTDQIQYSLTVAPTPASFKPSASNSRLIKRNSSDIKAVRVSAYKYLVL